MANPLCSIIILSYNQLDYTQKCLESIRQHTQDVTYEVIVIDNGSSADTVSYLKGLSGIRFFPNEVNQGFAGGCNQGIGLARGKYIMLLNNDTVVTQKWLSNMVRLLEQRPDIDMTGPLTNATVGKQMIPVPYDKDDLAGMQSFASQIAKDGAKPWRTLRLVAFCLLARKELFDEIGLFDTGFKIGSYEDDDFNIRALRAGKKAYICRNSFVHHFMNVSFRQKNMKREAIMLENKQYLEEKWGQMDWNHHSVYNRYMLQAVLGRRGGRLLHIGCGLGALEIELRDNGCRWYMAGMEEHPARAGIASEFMDQMVPYSIEGLAEAGCFDVILIECTLEKWGIPLLQAVRRLLAKDGLLLLRVFNSRHITTIERAVTGRVEGRLLCAASEGFCYYFDSSVEGQIEALGFRILARQDIRKGLSSLQARLLEAVREFLPDAADAEIYNRIYAACLK